MYMFRKMKKFLNPSNLPKVLVLLLILVLLVYVYTRYAKEGFHCQPHELDEHIQSSEPTMVLFYADWCGHCKKLKPTWEQTAKQANTDRKRMVHIDVGGKTPEQKELMDRYQIDGFPTILIFQDGKHTPYEGSRTADAFLKALG